MVVHEKKKPYKCHLCAFTFAEKSNLLKHCQAVHKINALSTQMLPFQQQRQKEQEQEEQDQKRDSLEEEQQRQGQQQQQEKIVSVGNSLQTQQSKMDINNLSCSSISASSYHT